ncbi:hypothetical protein LZ31DRAFT_3787 [Colletotrichum somersetense]|nr:hypothetical protein LZ31DRAFT_3787 [Colletotrichum somersetense]
MDVICVRVTDVLLIFFTPGVVTASLMAPLRSVYFRYRLNCFARAAWRRSSPNPFLISPGGVGPVLSGTETARRAPRARRAGDFGTILDFAGLFFFFFLLLFFVPTKN